MKLILSRRSKTKPKFIQKVVAFFHEVGHLNLIHRSPRKNNPFTVAEHSYRVTIISFILCQMKQAQLQKVLPMALFHDLPETRIGDLDLIQHHYLHANELEILSAQLQGFAFNQELEALFAEYIEGKTVESKIVRDADMLEEMLTEKKQLDQGDPRAAEWIVYTQQRLVTKEAKLIAQEILSQKSDDWWYALVKQHKPIS